MDYPMPKEVEKASLEQLRNWKRSLPPPRGLAGGFWWRYEVDVARRIEQRLRSIESSKEEPNEA